jgi:hypothetical protein
MTWAIASTTLRMRGIAWSSGCVMVVLGFYLVSSQVMTMRAQLDHLLDPITSDGLYDYGLQEDLSGQWHYEAQIRN